MVPGLAETSRSDREGQLGPLPYSPLPPQRQEGTGAGAHRPSWLGSGWRGCPSHGGTWRSSPVTHSFQVFMEAVLCRLAEETGPIVCPLALMGKSELLLST